MLEGFKYPVCSPYEYRHEIYPALVFWLKTGSYNEFEYDDSPGSIKSILLCTSFAAEFFSN